MIIDENKTQIQQSKALPTTSQNMFGENQHIYVDHQTLP